MNHNACVYHQSLTEPGWGDSVCVLRHSFVPRSLRPHGLQLTRLLCPWDSPGKKTGVGCHVLLQGIFQVQGLNPCLLCLPELAGRFFTTSSTWEAHVVYSSLLSSFVPGWMKHKLESRLPGEISRTSDTQMIPPLWQEAKKS